MKSNLSLLFFLAILIAHYLHAENIGWVAFSGYMVMRVHLSDTLMRGGLRFVDTVMGIARLLYNLSYWILCCAHFFLHGVSEYRRCLLCTNQSF